MYLFCISVNRLFKQSQFVILVCFSLFSCRCSCILNERTGNKCVFKINKWATHEISMVSIIFLLLNKIFSTLKFLLILYKWKRFPMEHDTHFESFLKDFDKGINIFFNIILHSVITNWNKWMWKENKSHGHRLDIHGICWSWLHVNTYMWVHVVHTIYVHIVLIIVFKNQYVVS